MKVEFINPFITAGIDVLAHFVGGGAEVGQLAVRTAVFTTQAISIVVEVSGAISGQVIYSMSQVTATKISSAMAGSQLVSFDEMALNAITELGKLISGQALGLLAESGYQCLMSPPTVVRGMNIKLATNRPALLLPLYTKCGKVDITVSLLESDEHAANGR